MKLLGRRLGHAGGIVFGVMVLCLSNLGPPAHAVTPEDLAEALGSVAYEFENILIRTGYTSNPNVWILDVVDADPDESALGWFTDTTFEDRLAAAPGHDSGSLLLSTGRAEDEGLGDTAFGGPDSDLMDLTVFSVSIQSPPSGTRYLVFTYQFVTSEYDGTLTSRNDHAVLVVRDWGDAHSVQIDTLADVHSASSSHGPRVTYAVPVGDIGGAVSSRTVILGIFDADDGAGDSGLLISDVRFTSEEMNPPGSPADFVNPPGYETLSSGVYTYNRELLHVPGAGLPLSFTLHYSSAQPRSGCFGRRWRHGYDWFITEQGAQMIVNRGDGGRDYFRRNNGGYDAQYGSTTQLQRFGEEFIYTTKEQVRYRFDSQKRLARITDRNDNFVSLLYDGDGRLTRIDDTRGNSADFEYEGDRCVSITYPGLSPIRFDYDERYDSEHGDLKEITELCGNTLSFTYDEHGNLLSGTRNQSLRIIENRYWPFRELLRSQVDTRGGQSDFGYGTDSMWVRSPLGYIRYMVFDDYDRPVIEIDPLGNQTRHEYDANNNIIRETDPRGYVTRMTYDASRNLTSRTNPLGRTVTMTYDSRNNLTTRTDESGATTRYGYDGAGNLTSVEDPLGHRSYYQYTAWGEIERMTDARGNWTDYDYYTETGDIASVTVRGESYTATTSFTYDDWGNRLTVTDPNGHLTRYEYDETGTVTAEIDALAGRTDYTYDSLGRLLSLTNAAGAKTRFEYDDNGNQIRVIGPLGHPSERVFDAENKLTERIDPLGRVTSYRYDAAGRLVGVTDALGRTFGATHDEAGNVTSITDANGNATAFTYDACGRLIRVTGQGEDETYAYDDRGALQRTSNARRVVEYSYDVAGRASGMTGTRLADGASETVQYGLDEVGNRVTSRIQFRTLSRDFDPERRVTRRTDEFGNAIGYAYDAAGNLTGLTYSDGKRVTYEYDALNRLTAVTDWNGRRTEYDYDPVGNVTATTLPDGSTVEYSYDIAGQLIEVHDVDPDGATIYRAQYTWDAAGQLTRERTGSTLPTILAEQDLALTYDRGNRTTAGEGMSGHDTFVHDESGNLTRWERDGGAYRSFEYDPFDRLSVYRTSDFVYHHVYDPDGMRAQTRIDLPSGQTDRVVRYVYDFNITPPRLLEEQNGNGQILARYVHGIGLVSRESAAGELSVYHFDSRGSTIALTDAQGSVTDRYAYDPYGNVAAREGDSANPFTYVGRYGVVDDGNGLYFARTRYYSPELMRFIQKDLLRGTLAFPETLNQYVYGDGNPIATIDPDGESPTLVLALIGVGVGLAAQGMSDLISGEFSGWEAYAGAAVAGAIIGATAGAGTGWAAVGYGVMAGAGAAAAGNLTEQGLKTYVTHRQGGIDWGNFATDVAIGAAAGAIVSGGGAVYEHAAKKAAQRAMAQTLKEGGAKAVLAAPVALTARSAEAAGKEAIKANLREQIAGVFVELGLNALVGSFISRPGAPGPGPEPGPPSPTPIGGRMGLVPAVQTTSGNCCGVR